MRPLRGRRAGAEGALGFTLIEMALAISILVVALMALAGVIVTNDRHREEVAARRVVLAEAESILEEIKGAVPEAVAGTYHGATYPVSGVTGNGAGGTALTVNVDATNSKLLEVTVTGSWVSLGVNQTLTLRTQIYNPNG